MRGRLFFNRTIDERHFGQRIVSIDEQKHELRDIHA